jgi:hypothetical protein
LTIGHFAQAQVRGLAQEAVGMNCPMGQQPKPDLPAVQKHKTEQDKKGPKHEIQTNEHGHGRVCAGRLAGRLRRE